LDLTTNVIGNSAFLSLSVRVAVKVTFRSPSAGRVTLPVIGSITDESLLPQVIVEPFPPLSVSVSMVSAVMVVEDTPSFSSVSAALSSAKRASSPDSTSAVLC